MENPFEVLGVKSTDSEEKIRSAYRALARKYHPDSPSGDQAKFIQVDTAWKDIKVLLSNRVTIKKDVWRHRSFFNIYKEA